MTFKADAIGIIKGLISEDMLVALDARNKAEKFLARENSPAPKAVDLYKLISEANAAAASATEKYLNAQGGDTYPCGFAWVNIKPARGPLVTALKKEKIGRTDDYYGGYSIWNPSKNSCQSMYAKEAGAWAFADVLKAAGFKATVSTRLD